MIKLIKKKYNNIIKFFEKRFYENRYNNIKSNWKLGREISWTEEEKDILYSFAREKFYDYLFKLEKNRDETKKIFNTSIDTPVMSNTLLEHENMRLNRILREGIQPDILHEKISIFEYYYDSILKEHWQEKINELK